MHRRRASRDEAGHPPLGDADAQFERVGVHEAEERLSDRDVVARRDEALAAIPAVLAYNRFAAESDGLLSRYEIFAEELSSILHREAHSARSSTGH